MTKREKAARALIKRISVRGASVVGIKQKGVLAAGLLAGLRACDPRTCVCMSCGDDVRKAILDAMEKANGEEL